MAKPGVLKWETPEDLEKEFKEYFKKCEENNKMPTKAGLMLHFDITDETLLNYKKKSKAFLGAIQKAHKHIEEAWNQALKGSNATGPIFYLKAAFHYKDRVDVTSDDKEIGVSPERQAAIDKLLDNE